MCAVSNEEEGRGEERKKGNFPRTDIRKKSGQRASQSMNYVEGMIDPFHLLSKEIIDCVD